jgi:hypothetical protein
MERLIQLLDDLDDLLAPAFTVLTRRHWLRGGATLALIVLIAQAGGSWPLGTMVGLPVFPLADLARKRVRRLASAGFQLPAFVSLGSRS